MPSILLAPFRLSLSSSAADGATPSHDFSRYDAYLGSIPVLFHSDAEVKPQTELLPVQPTRQDTGQNPAEIRPDFGNIFGQTDFSHGALQDFFHHLGRDEQKYYSSEGFDISEPGALRHLHATIEDDNGAVFTDAGPCAQAQGLPFVLQGQRVYVGDGNWPQSWTEEDPTDAGTDRDLYDITSSGTEVFVGAATDGIWVRDQAGTWTNDYTGASVTIVSWVKDRLMCSDGDSIFEITAAGALPSAIETLPSGWSFTDIFEAGPFVVATAAHFGAQLGRLHIYGLNDAGTAIEKKGSTGLPKGDLAYTGLSYLGRTLVAGGRVNSSGGLDPLLYEVIVQDDASAVLTFVNAGSGAGASDLSVRAMDSMPDTIIFGWSEGRRGLGAYGLARNAFSFHLKAGDEGAAAKINGVLYIDGRVMFCVDGGSVYFEDIDTPVSEAELVTSVADWNNYGYKIWDLIEINHDTLIVGTSVDVQYTQKHPDSDDWVDAMSSGTPGSQGKEVRVSEVFARRVALKIISFASATASPVVRAFGFRSNPAPTEPDWVITRTIRLLDKDRKNGRAEAVKIDPRTVRGQLQDLAYQWVTLYEPGVTWEAFVQSVKEIQPANPAVSETAGTSAKEAYYIQLTMVGRRVT